MEFAAVDSLASRKTADVLVVPFVKAKQKSKGKAGERQSEDIKSACGETAKFSVFFQKPIEHKDFKAKEGEVLFVYPEKNLEPRIAMLGLGSEEKITVETLRRAYASVVKACRQKHIKQANICLPNISSLPEDQRLKGAVEGVLLANYAFEKLKNDTLKEDPSTLIEKTTWIGGGKNAVSLSKKSFAIAEGVYLARDLVNGNADVVTPQYLGECAKKIAKEFPSVKATVFDKKRIEKEKMGLLLAVNRSSKRDPAFIILEYKGNPKSKDTTVLVGKGVTYDTGGLNLKPTGFMETMKCDMAGAAAALGTLFSVAKLGLKVNLTVVIPSTENCIGGDSYKPGDVYQSYSGKTVEIANTDAEGRLILADALSFASKHLNPSRIIDFATLTGAVVIALGPEAIGLMSNEDALADLLLQSGQTTYERLWRLPLYEEYKEHIKSDIADMKNSSGKRDAGTINGGMFLQEFVGDIPWAHCDIAATGYFGEARRYHPKHGTGIGVRLMVDFLENL